MRLAITFQQTYVEIKLAQIELVLAFDDLNPCASATKWNGIAWYPILVVNLNVNYFGPGLVTKDLSFSGI
jgi:hypothetical protein